VLGVYLGWTNAVGANSTVVGIDFLLQIAGSFIKGSITLIVFGVCVILLGRAIRWYLERDPRVLRNAALIVSIAWTRQIFDLTGDVLTKSGENSVEKLMYAIIVGILIGVASILVVIAIHRSASGFFEETGKQVEEIGAG
jgi:uncharacterized membrane protein